MALLKKAAADRKNQRLHGDILEEQGIPEEEEEEATQDQEPSSTVTVFENLSLNTNANNNWEKRGSGRMILERQDAEQNAPRPHNIREMGFSNNFVPKSSPELSHEDVDPVVVVRRRESSGGPSPLKKLKGKRVLRPTLDPSSTCHDT